MYLHSDIYLYSPNIFCCFSDINECIINNGGCEQVCINTEGSYRCACHQGYSYNEDSGECIG